MNMINTIYSKLILIVIIVLNTIITNPLSANSDQKIDSDTKLADEAFIANPSIKAIEKQISSLKYKVKYREIIKDPVLSFEYSNFPWNSLQMGDTPMTGLQVKLKQTIPYKEKNLKRQAVAKSEINIHSWHKEEQKLVLENSIRIAFWKLTIARQLKLITREHLSLIEKFTKAVRAKYETGRVGQHQLLRLNVLYDKLNDDIKEFTKTEHILTSQINSSIYRDINFKIYTALDSKPLKPYISISNLLNIAKEERPKLKYFTEIKKMHKIKADLFDYEKHPDISIWTGYRLRKEAGMDDGTDLLTVGISCPLPIDYTNRYDSLSKEQLLLADKTENEYLNLLNNIELELKLSLTKWERAYQKANDYETKLVPSARKTVEAILTAYKTDRADFLSLYQAELQLLEFERTIKISKVETHIQNVVIETVIGKRLKN